jgi:hypothetical protein
VTRRRFLENRHMRSKTAPSTRSDREFGADPDLLHGGHPAHLKFAFEVFK